MDNELSNEEFKFLIEHPLTAEYLGKDEVEKLKEFLSLLQTYAACVLMIKRQATQMSQWLKLATQSYLFTNRSN